MRKFLGTCIAIAMFFAAHTAMATTYNVVAVLDGSSDPGNVPGFGASSLHVATHYNDASGGILANFATVSGTYDSVSGLLDVTLTSTNGETVDLNGDFDFTGTQLTNDVFANLRLDQALSTGGGTTRPSGDYHVKFKGGAPVCCSGPYAPNSLAGIPHTDMLILTLWGAGPLKSGNYYQNPYKFIGADLQFKLTPVPLPAAVWLFGSAIIGLVGVGRRRKVLQAA